MAKVDIAAPLACYPMTQSPTSIQKNMHIMNKKGNFGATSY